MQHTQKTKFVAAVGFSLLAALAGGNALAQSGQGQQVQARVTAASPVREADGSTGYNVAYEYNGRTYTTRTSGYPGSTVSVEVSPYGVATLPVAPQASLSPGESLDNRAPWEQAVPEQGVVVSSARGAAPAYYAAPPVYAAPVYAAPVYVQPGYGYGYGYAPYAYPPVGVSLNLGYSRGWGGGHRGWR
ncbi:MAG: hypothetical protein ACRYGA_09325 [Janthinobacterium lividum]